MHELRLRRFFFCLAVVGLCFVSTPRAQERAEDVIRATLQTYATAWNTANAHGIAELYTVDADYTGYGSVMTRGRSEIEARYASLFTGAFAGTQLTVDMSSLRFIKPDVAIVDGSLDLTAHAPDGTPQVSKGLFIAIMTDDGGQWKFTTFWSKRLQIAPPQAPSPR
jgi:uncharacterized protein (TIGR02246 family)